MPGRTVMRPRSISVCGRPTTTVFTRLSSVVRVTFVAAFAQHNIGQRGMRTGNDHIGLGNAERRKRLRFTRRIVPHSVDILRLGFAGQRQHILRAGFTVS